MPEYTEHTFYGKSKQYFKNFINKARNVRFIFKIIIYILIPIIIFTLFFSYVSVRYKNQYIELVETNYLTKLESVCNNIESTIASTTNTINNSVCTYVPGTAPISEYHNMSNILLSQLEKNDNSLINSIFIFDKANRLVYDSNGGHNAVAYFIDTLEYTSYPLNYWEYYPYKDETTRALRPTISFRSDKSSVLIPIVFSNTGMFTGTDCLVVVNVDISKIIDYENKNKLSDNTEFLIVNNTTGAIFNETMDFKKKPKNGFLDKITSATSTVFDTELGGEDYIIMSYRPLQTPELPYTYVAAMPYRDIQAKTNKFTSEIMILFMLVLIVIIFAIRFSVQKIFKPVKDLSDMISDEEESKSDPLDSIRNSFYTLSNKNLDLSTTINSLMPLATERKLIEVLNGSTDITLNSENFKYEYFCSVIVTLIPTKMFFKEYTSQEYKQIKRELSKIIMTPISEKFDIYTIPANPDTIYMFINAKDDDCKSEIIKALDEFTEILKHDENYISVEYAIGGIYRGIEHIKTSHNEATAATNISSQPSSSQVKLNSAENDVLLPIKMENTIYNMLILGKTEKAKDEIRDIIDEKVKHASNDSMTKLYIQLLNLIFKSMRAKKIEFDQNDMGELNLISSILDNPKPKIHATIMQYIDILDASKAHKRTNAKIDIDDFVEYIDTHYVNDLSLAKVAEHLGTTPKYLSKLIKNKFNITFLEYLSTMRVNAAKDYLANTDLSIAEIYQKAGFNSKNTFLRAFKASTGVNPSDFRKSKKQNLL